MRCALESLALQYRTVLEELRRVLGAGIDRIHVLGGGGRNELLNRMTADATGLPVAAGPAEATSIGNIIVQARALGHTSSLGDARATVARSFKIEDYEPGKTGAWDTAWNRYMELKVKK